jgi:L-lactate utilization protein LutC
MITSRQKGGKKLEEIPKDVIVLAYADQLVDKLNEGLTAIREKYLRDIPTQIGTIHGPHQTVQADSPQSQINNLFLVLSER